MVATRADVARLAGVSPSTVTYVLTGARPTSEATRGRVRNAVEELGYHPDRNASLLASRALSSVGVLLRMERSAIDAADLEYVDGIRDCLEAAGMQVVVPMGMRSDSTSALSQLVRSRSVHAAILMDVAPDDERERFLLSEDVPTVLIGRSGPGGRAPSIDADFDTMADMAARHLAALGHLRVLFLMRAPEIELANVYLAQIEAVTRAARSVGLSADFRSLPDDAIAGASLVSRDGLESACTAVVSNSPVALTGLLAGAWSLGLRAPRDFAALSLGLTVASSVPASGLTEVAIDARLMGHRAGNLLLRLGADRSLREHVLMEPRLVDRGSTGPASR